MAEQEYNDRLIAEFRANGGHVSGSLQGKSVLLLHHVGAKSGIARVTPVAYLPDGQEYVIFASKAGAPNNPAWYHNLMAHPNTQIEVGERIVDIVATEETGAERDRLYAAMLSCFRGSPAISPRVGG